MNSLYWLERFPSCAFTVCDPEGIVLEMNQTAIEVFKDSGGAKLIGTNILDCHPEPARTKFQQLLETRQTNVYTIEKRGVKKLIYQTPWYHEDNTYGGFIEISLPIPFDMPHFVRG
jgi:hypothetical protein